MLIEFKGLTAIPADKILCIKSFEGKTWVHLAAGLCFAVEDPYQKALAKYRDAMGQEKAKAAAHGH